MRLYTHDFNREMSKSITIVGEWFQICHGGTIAIFFSVLCSSCFEEALPTKAAVRVAQVDKFLAECPTKELPVSTQYVSGLLHNAFKAG